MKTKINAQIVAHSKNEQGDELISVLATFPRIILAEVNTHRMLSKNTSSSRAIPFNKMVETIKEDPFIPIAWQKEHKGMQGTEYFTDLDNDIPSLERGWLSARDSAIETSKYLNKCFENEDGSIEGVTKQLCNRLLEPFMWTTMLITGPKSGWDNFFHLRCPQYEIYAGPTDTEEYLCTGKSWKDLLKSNGGLAGDFNTDNVIERLAYNKGQAEIHMMMLAECIWDSVNESTPKQLVDNQWHIPFSDKINLTDLFNTPPEKPCNVSYTTYNGIIPTPVKISVAMAARTSYTVVGEEKGIDYEAMIGLHDRLLAQDPPHSSPLEHCAKCMHKEEYETFHKGKLTDLSSTMEGFHPTHNKDKGWCNNLKGFIPYRYMVDNGKID